MKKKNKGFTMVELLAVITIMGLLSAIAIPAVTKYIAKGKNTSYESMFKSSYEAAENYMMQNDIVIAKYATQEIPLSTLVDEQYLESLIDPGSDKDKCESHSESKVVVKRLDNTEGGMPNYQYTVYLKCKSFDSVKNEVFPK